MIRTLGLVALLASAACLAVPSNAAGPEPTRENSADPVLPPDADDRADQAPYLAEGTYLTEAGVVAPLPDPAEHPGEDADDDGVPGMKLH